MFDRMVGVGLSIGEKNFIRGGIAQDLCCDGRKRLSYRPINVETSVVQQANGSARIKIGGIDIIASVKAELGRPSSSRPDHGKVSIHVDCSASVQLLHRCIRVKEMKNYRQTGTCSTARPIGVKVLLTYLLMEVRRKNLK
ncbi:uncharacterized protein LOC141611112 isoform X3 [Silene latifolia]|uniref:uncharacterized protein LOC141611112 isoform X3 n=1 Tax=Silene latifolia TaxID=37657 RepID=UPI003D77E37E